MKTNPFKELGRQCLEMIVFLEGREQDVKENEI